MMVIDNDTHHASFLLPPTAAFYSKAATMSHRHHQVDDDDDDHTVHRPPGLPQRASSSYLAMPTSFREVGSSISHFAESYSKPSLGRIFSDLDCPSVVDTAHIIGK